MARRSLKPQLNQIRAWVQQGRTDAWIAHQLEISASELREFRKQHDLTADAEGSGGSEVDLRDEIEAEVEAATAEEAEEEPEEDEGDDEAEDTEDTEDAADEVDEKPARKPKPRARKAAAGGGESDEEGAARPRRRRRRGRRGGRGRRKELEATFDHGERDGYGLWLDAAVKDNPLYAEHWAGKREVTVRIDADQIVIRRAGESGPADGDDDSDE
jgi:hypothetical protein